MADSDMRCHLLALPAELRNRIYGYVFYVGDVYLMKRRESFQPHAVLSLLSTCRQINKEASGIFYAANTFKIKLPWLWLLNKQISHARLQHITVITVQLQSPLIENFVSTLFELRHFTNLRILNVEFQRSTTMNATDFISTIEGVCVRFRIKYQRRIEQKLKKLQHLESIHLASAEYLATPINGLNPQHLSKLEGEIQGLIDERKAERLFGIE